MEHLAAVTCRHAAALQTQNLEERSALSEQLRQLRAQLAEATPAAKSPRDDPAATTNTKVMFTSC